MRKEMDAAVEAAKRDPVPPSAELYKDVYSKQSGDMFIRGPDLPSSHGDTSWAASS